MGHQSGASVDFAYLAGIVAGDAVLVDEVLAIFCQQTAVWRPKLAPGGGGWRDTVHSIKGAGRSIGAVALGDACERAELRGDGDLAEVIGALEAALVDIAAYRAANPAG